MVSAISVHFISTYPGAETHSYNIISGHVSRSDNLMQKRYDAFIVWNVLRYVSSRRCNESRTLELHT